MLGKAVFLRARGIRCRVDAGSCATPSESILAETTSKAILRPRDTTGLQAYGFGAHGKNCRDKEQNLRLDVVRRIRIRNLILSVSTRLLPTVRKPVSIFPVDPMLNNGLPYRT